MNLEQQNSKVVGKKQNKIIIKSREDGVKRCIIALRAQHLMRVRRADECSSGSSWQPELELTYPKTSQTLACVTALTLKCSVRHQAPGTRHRLQLQLQLRLQSPTPTPTPIAAPVAAAAAAAVMEAPGV